MLSLLRVLTVTVAAVVVMAAPAAGQISIPITGMSTGPALDVRETSATLQFTMVPTVFAGRAYIQYGTTAALGQQSAPYPFEPSEQPTVGPIEITGLTPETTYYYRAYLENDVRFYSRGKMLTFTTLAAPPPREEPRTGGGGGTGGGPGTRGQDAPRPPACASAGARAVTAGSATLTLDRAFVQSLASAGYRTSATGAATSAGRTWKLPLTGGALDARLRAGRLCANGGLALRARRRAGTAIDGVTLTLAGRRPQLSARLGRRTVALATLGPVALAGSGRARTASRIRATLTAAGASALRGALGTRAPRAGAALGTLALRVTLR